MHLKKTNIFHILLPPLVVALLFFISAFWVFLPSFQDSLLNKKKEMIRELTNTAWSIVASYEKLERTGKMTRETAQREATQRVREIRYGSENKDYFWINDMTPTMVMHPYRPDLEGQNLQEFSDPAGNYLFRDFVNTAQKNNAGYVPYMWQWKDDSTRIVPKLSYIRSFSPWGWVIGTGIYLDDVDKEITVLSRSLVIFSVIILTVVLIISYFIVRQGIAVAEKYRLSEEEVRRHRDHLEELVEKRTSELATSNAELRKEVEQKIKAQEQIQKDHAFLSTIIESLPFPFYVTNVRDYSILMANTMACKKGGGSGGKCYALTHGRTSPCSGTEHLCPLHEVKRVRKPVKTEHIHTDRYGRTEYVEVHGYPIFDEKGDVVQMIEFALDITKRKELEEQLRQASITDSLTGLYNRRGFMTMAEKQLELSKRIDNRAYLLFVDLDGMKQINDTLGHDAGDKALVATATILKDYLREADVIARLGGDEFAAFIFNGTSQNHAETIVKRLEEKTALSNAEKQFPFSLSLSCGILLIDKEAKHTLEELLSLADSLMYEQKKTKKHRGDV